MKMRSPSARVLRNTADLYLAIEGQDASGGVTYTYPGVPTQSSVRCSVQYTDTGLDPERLERLTVVNIYHVMFATDYKLGPRDKIVWRDTQPNRTLFVESSPPSEAGRGGTFVVRAVEKL